MKHQVRFKCLFFLFVAMVLLVAACGKPTPTPTPPPEPDTAAAPPEAADEELDDLLVKAVEEGNVPEAERLLDAGADPMAPTPMGPLPVLAATQGNPDMIGLLGGRGADFSMPGANGMAPINIAASAGNQPAVEKMLDMGVDVNSMDTMAGGGTPLMHAVDTGNLDMAEMLIGQGADTNMANPDGQTPLHSAVDLDNMEMVEMLIGSGADPNLQNAEGSTPSHLAAENNNLDIFQLLSDSGADLSIMNNDGQLPLELGDLFTDMDVDELQKLLPDMNLGDLAPGDLQNLLPGLGGQ